MTSSTLKPAAQLASTNTTRHLNGSAEYRRARQALLVEEIELRRHLERVAELRRALPPGGEVTKPYEFESEAAKVTLADLFGDKKTIVIYSYMFGPHREQPCPMCPPFMSTCEAKLIEHAGSIKVQHTPRPFAVAMAGENEFDPFKD